MALVCHSHAGHPWRQQLVRKQCGGPKSRRHTGVRRPEVGNGTAAAVPGEWSTRTPHKAGDGLASWHSVGGGAGRHAGPPGGAAGATPPPGQACWHPGIRSIISADSPDPPGPGSRGVVTPQLQREVHSFQNRHPKYIRTGGKRSHESLPPDQKAEGLGRSIQYIGPTHQKQARNTADRDSFPSGFSQPREYGRKGPAGSACSSNRLTATSGRVRSRCAPGGRVTS